ncbi:MAG: RidA family protein [Betaproteobacteria bacterium]|nr:RidA family protein [Betaproteobacteria bacterium]
MRTLETLNAPGLAGPAGHYSHAVVHRGIAYLAGQLPHAARDPGRKPGTIEEQARQVLANIDEVLRACGSRRDRVLRCTVYVSDIAHWPAVNKVYAEFFGEHRPARSVVPVNELHHGYAIEVDVIAALDE